MSEKQEAVPVEVRMAIVERNIAAAMQQIYDHEINIEAALLGTKEGDKESPEVAQLRKQAAGWMAKRNFFNEKLKVLEAEKAEADKAKAEKTE